MCLPNWVWIQIFHKYSRDVNINWYKDINKWNQQNLKKHFSTTSQFIVLWKHKAKKFTENDYDKWALNDFHIPHNMISTCSGYPFFFCGQDHWFQRHIWNIFAFFRRITTSRSWSRLVRILLNKNCNFIFQRLPQINSWSCSHKGSHQSKNKVPTNIKRIEFAKRFLMLTFSKHYSFLDTKVFKLASVQWENYNLKSIKWWQASKFIC